MNGIYEQTHEFLDPDERMIPRELYERSPWMYDAVRGTVSLHRHIRTGDLDWAFNNRTLYIDHDTWTFLGEYLIVRLASKDVLESDLITPEELEENRDRYIVMEVYIKLVSKRPPFRSMIVTHLPSHININAYHRLGVLYRVRFKSFEDIDI